MNRIIPKSRFIEIYFPYLLLGLVTFSFFFFLIDYVFFFQEKGGLFLTSLEYFFGHFNRPGGMLMYLSEFLTAFYFYPAAGAFILAAVIVLSAFLVQQIQKCYSEEHSLILPFVIAGILFYLQSDYHTLLFNGLGMILQLIGFYFAVKTDRILKGWIPVFVFPFWYFLTGSLALMFALQYSLHLILKKEKRAVIQIVVLWLLFMVFLYLSKEYFFYFSLRELLAYPFKASLPDWHLRIYFALAAVLILLPAISLLKLNFLHKKPFSGPFVDLGIPVLIITASLLLVGKQISPKDKHYFRVEKLFYLEKFDEVIEFNRKNPSANILTSFLNNISLSEKGQLADRLFEFPQSSDAKTLFLPWEMSSEILRRGGYFYYSIGMINEAHRWAYENMVMNGFTPEGLKMLIKTELINGNTRMAGKYIDFLNGTFFYRKVAEEFRKLALNEASIDQNAELGAKRKMKSGNDFFILASEPMLNLAAALNGNPGNQKALDYEMAFFLLKKDFNGIISNLHLYNNKSGEYLPVNIEEAVVAYKTLGIGHAEVVDHLNIRQETIDRFTSYLQTFKQFGNNKASAQQALFKGFGNTFWYYIFYK